jgi:hypothetical protein
LPSSVGYSASQARFLALTIFSLLHASNFIMIGSQSGFSVTFLAYAVAAFSRAFLVGQNHAHINYSRFSDAFRQRPCDFYNFISSVFFCTKIWFFRNAYFASGPKQSIGYAFGIWSEL